MIPGDRLEMKEKFLPLPDGKMMERRIVSGSLRKGRISRTEKGRTASEYEKD